MLLCMLIFKKPRQEGVHRSGVSVGCAGLHPAFTHCNHECLDARSGKLTFVAAPRLQAVLVITNGVVAYTFQKLLFFDESLKESLSTFLIVIIHHSSSPF